MTTHFILVAALLGTAGEAVRSRCSANTAYADPAQSETEVECPDFVRGAKLSMRDVDGGVELKITTPWTVHLKPLRELLQQLAVVVEDHTHTQQVGAQDETEIPPVDITVKDIDSGSLITIKADSARHVPIVREQARMLDEFWQSSECINGSVGRMALR
jgi:hypothetical protein